MGARKNRERDGHLAGIDPAFEFLHAADTADEVDALVAALVGDAGDGQCMVPTKCIGHPILINVGGAPAIQIQD